MLVIQTNIWILWGIMNTSATGPDRCALDFYIFFTFLTSDKVFLLDEIITICKNIVRALQLLRLSKGARSANNSRQPLYYCILIIDLYRLILNNSTTFWEIHFLPFFLNVR